MAKIELKNGKWKCRCENCNRIYKADAGVLVGGSGGLLGGYTDTQYCSPKCRREAEGGQGGGKSESAHEEEYESGGGSSSSGSGGTGVVGSIITVVVLILLLIIVLAAIFSKDEDASDPAVKMAKWEEHLEKRRAAFAEGLSEEGVEARGFKNYSWEEWQNRDQSRNKKPVEKEVNKSLKDIWHEYHQIRRDLYASGHTTAQILELGVENLDFEEFSERYKDKDAEAELKKLKDRIAELDAARNDSAKQSSTAVPKVVETRPVVQPDVVKPMVEKPKPIVKPTVEKPKPVAKQHTAQPKVEERKPVASGSGKSAVSGQPNNTGNKASKDSTGIAITVKGKGKTKDAAVRWAVREAVWQTVGTWVDSKERIKENHDKVVDIVKSITSSDVRKYEILESHNEDGNIVMKVKVHVSKKMIAPKFAKVFPDVFGNDNK